MRDTKLTTFFKVGIIIIQMFKLYDKLFLKNYFSICAFKLIIHPM